MKFILSESKRFLLEERFTLNEDNTLLEASAEAVAQSWTQKFKATFDTTEAVLKKYIEYAGLTKAASAQQTQLKTLKSKLDPVAQELANTMELPIEDLAADKFATAKAELTNYVQALVEIQKSVNSTAETADTFTLLATKIKALNVLRTRFGQWKPQDSATVKDTLNWVSKNINPILSTASLDANAAGVETFKQLCTECLEALQTFKTELPDQPESFTGFSAEDIKAYCTPIKQLIDTVKLPDPDKLNKGVVVKNLATCQAQAQAIKEIYTQVLQTPVMVKAKQETADKIQVESDPKTTDWAVKFAEAVNKEAVIEEFIYTTWPKQGSQVLAIKQALLEECTYYGFTESENKFLSFINSVYLNQQFSMRPLTYNVIHNLVANNSTKILSPEDLIGKGSLQKGNLIFCKALYALDDNAIKLYLTKQANLLKASPKTDSPFQEAPEMAFNILYKVDTVQRGSQTQEAFALTLRPMADIEQLEKKWVGTVSNTKDSTPATNAEILNQIQTKENAIKVITTLALKFSSHEKIRTTANACPEIKQYMTNSLSIIDLQKLVASVETTYKLTNITAEKALELIKTIIQADRFELTKGQ